MAADVAKLPRGVPFIIGNEAAERFSFYGMRTILIVFMTKFLMDAHGANAPMSETEAKVWFHTFVMGNYFFPLLGALVADIFWNKYRTIMSLSIVYCLGHLALALFETRMGLALGLTLIAIGSGGIKPCVSAHVGDQFSSKNQHLLSKTFSYFYFSINFGAFFSTMLTPWLLVKYGSGVAFGIPGVLMLLATIVFYAGRRFFTVIPAAGWTTYKKALTSPEGKKALMSLPIIYFFIAIFWSLYDQTGSAWVLQAEKLDRVVNLGFTSFELLPAQVQAVNPILIMLFTPIFYFGIYPFIERFIKFGALRKMGAGFVLAALSFALVAYVEGQLQKGVSMSMVWQLWAYVIITSAEVMVSITALEFSYTQAPNTMKSLITGLFLLSVSFGNAITALVNYFIENPDGTTRITGDQYYWFFTIMMGVTSVGYVFVARMYQEKTYLQEGGAGQLSETAA